MRVFGFRVPFFVAVLLLGFGSTVWALGYRRGQVETVYLGPATTTLAVPTSYVVTTSWVEPTSYLVPTGYTTAYVADPVAVVQPAYVATSYYVKTGLFGRQRLVERPVIATYGPAYLPTTYYAPTGYYTTTAYVPTVRTDPMVWPTSYVASADCVCPDQVALATLPSRGLSAAKTAPPSGSESKIRQSEPADGPAMDSAVGPAPAEKAPASGSRVPANPVPVETGISGARGGMPDASSPPQVPPVTRPAGEQPSRPNESPAPLKPAPTTTNPPAGTNPNPNAAAPVAPPVPGELEPVVPGTNPPGEFRYQARRPAYSTRLLRTDTRNVLLGVVQSRSGGQPEEGVRIRVTNGEDQSRDKSTLTDAFGRFAMHLTDGDWTVHVTMPSGRIYPVSEIRVTNGEIVDSLGRRVPSLEITR
ncbi:MAG: hypothetical protein ACLQGP_28090 [Isosphaeraceae bacterium]